MSSSMQVIDQLYKEKLAVVRKVYEVNDLDEIYRRQSSLSSMAINIYTDAAQVMMPALIADGLRAVAWADISEKLSRLNFIGVPTGAEIREKCGIAAEQACENPKNGGFTIRPEKEQQVVNARPQEDEQIKLKIKKLAKAKNYIAGMLQAGNNSPKPTPGKKQAGKLTWKQKNSRSADSVKQEPAADNDSIYRWVIKQVKEKNIQELDRWFEDLRRLTQKELDKKNPTEEVWS